MQVYIKGLPENIFVHTVSLTETKDNNMQMFHCIYCGSSIQQYVGKVDKITPYIEPYDRALTVSKCRKCYAKYTFQSHNGREQAKTRVILYADPYKQTMFFCYLGRQPLLSYSADSIVSLHDRQPHSAPFSFHCTALDCPIEYFFREVV